MPDLPYAGRSRRATLDPRDLVSDLTDHELPCVREAVLTGTKRQVLDLLDDLAGRLRNTELVLHLTALQLLRRDDEGADR